MCVSKLRTIKQCIMEIKEADKETAITEWFIRSLCKSNKVKYMPNGTKILVDYNNLLSYLNGELI